MTLILGTAPARPATSGGRTEPANGDGGAGFAAELALAGGGDSTRAGTDAATAESGTPEAVAGATALPGAGSGVFPDVALLQALAEATAAAPATAVPGETPVALSAGAVAPAAAAPTPTGADASLSAAATPTVPMPEATMAPAAVETPAAVPSAAVSFVPSAARNGVPGAETASSDGSPAAAPASAVAGGTPIPDGETIAATAAAPTLAAPAAAPREAPAAPRTDVGPTAGTAVVAPEVLEAAASARVVGPRQAPGAEASGPAPQGVALPDATSPVAQTIRAEAPAAAAATARPAATPLNEQLAKPLFTLRAAPAGDHVMTLQVTPDNVGPVTVRAHVGAEAVRIELFAPNEQGREALRGILNDLKRDLSSGGMTTSLDISPDDQPGTGGGRESAAERRDRWDDRASFRASAGPAATTTAASRTAADPSSRLDVVV